MKFLEPRVPNWHPVCSTVSHFQGIAHFTIFPLTPMLKFQSATKCLQQLLFPHGSQCSHEVWLASNESVGGVVFWNFKVPYFFLIFGGTPKPITACAPPPPSDWHACHKVWLKLDENRGSSSLLKILTSEILQNAQNDPKLNSNDLTRNVPYIWSS